jgi:hypothetical protein
MMLMLMVSRRVRQVNMYARVTKMAVTAVTDFATLLVWRSQSQAGNTALLDLLRLLWLF